MSVVRMLRVDHPAKLARLSYHDPDEDVRTWEQSKGFAALEIAAGKAMHPKLRKFVEVGLPFGHKPRLILAHINTAAFRKGNLEIDTPRSLTHFISDAVELDSHGRNVKEQLTRLSTCSIRLGHDPRRPGVYRPVEHRHGVLHVA